MGPRSLSRMAEAVAIRNIEFIGDLGELPFWVVKGILERVKHADQLRSIEEGNPILRDDTPYLWHRMIGRDFRRLSERKQYEINEPTETWTLYYRYQREEEEQIALGLAKLKNDMKSVNQKNKATMLLPASQAPTLPSFRPWAGIDRSKFYTRYAGKTKGQIGLAKVVQKAKQVNQTNRITAKSIGFTTTRLSKAPKGMVLEHSLANRPRIAPTPIIRPPTTSIRRTTNPILISREERLQRIKDGKAPEPTPEEIATNPPMPNIPPARTTVQASSPPPPPPPALGGRMSAGPTKRNSGLLSFAPGSNSKLKPTRVAPKTRQSTLLQKDMIRSKMSTTPSKPRHMSPTPPLISSLSLSPAQKNWTPHHNTSPPPPSEMVVHGQISPSKTTDVEAQNNNNNNLGQSASPPPPPPPSRFVAPVSTRKRASGAENALRPMKRPRPA